ncbi:MAG: NAD(P)-dependent oxidoreductase [Planctomycetota bacterium]|nr:NAD(P)-dependent oxidoreductase [Planctomycetota bacterium]
MDTRIGFIGLGIMGAAMAGRLLEAKYPLCIHSRTKSKGNRLINRGARYLATPAEVAANSDIVLICVTDTPDVKAVIQGDDGILAGARSGMIVIDHSTISPSATRAMAAELSTRGVALLDAPVSGGDVGAKNGTLSIMVGGEENAFSRVEPILKRMGGTITYCGPSGTGQLTKLVNQILVSVTNLAVCEALVFARQHELNMEKTVAALAAGAGGSWQLTNLGPRMIAGDFRPGFSINLQQKDLKIVMQAAEESNTSLPTVSLAHQLFTAAQAAGHGKDGTQALFTVIEKLASVH